MVSAKDKRKVKQFLHKVEKFQQKVDERVEWFLQKVN
jgi:hypothetical protein